MSAEAGQVQPVTVRGLEGKQFDVVLEVPDDYSGICSTEPGALDCVDVSRLTSETGLVAFAEGFKDRIIFLEVVKGETITIDFGAPPGKNLGAPKVYSPNFR